MRSSLCTLKSTLHALHWITPKAKPPNQAHAATASSLILYPAHLIRKMTGSLYNPHSTLCIPHFTRSSHYTLHSTLSILQSTLSTPRSALSTPHSTLYTVTFHISHSQLSIRSPHSTLSDCKKDTPYFPVLLCTARLVQSTYNTLYYKARTKYFPILLCTIYKACTRHFSILLCTRTDLSATKYFNTLHFVAISLGTARRNKRHAPGM